MLSPSTESPPGHRRRPPAGMTERFDCELKLSCSEYSDSVQAMPAARGPRQRPSVGRTTGWISSLIALKPTGGGSATWRSTTGWWRSTATRPATYREGPASNVVNAYATNVAAEPDHRSSHLHGQR